jgi:hypothetical protein
LEDRRTLLPPSLGIEVLQSTPSIRELLSENGVGWLFLEIREAVLGHKRRAISRGVGAAKRLAPVFSTAIPMLHLEEARSSSIVMAQPSPRFT